MMALADFLAVHGSPVRIEKKFVLKKAQSLLAVRCLSRMNAAVVFQPRQVNSIYFDDFELSALRDNIDGNPYRDKLRVRWYGEDRKRATIEIKHKRNILGAKSSFALNGALSEEHLLYDVKRWMTLNVRQSLFPVSKVTYTRQYFMLGEIRVTADSQIHSHRLVGNQIVKSLNHDYEVIELKYEPSLDEVARSLIAEMERFSLRPGKCSKYANSLMDFNITVY